jgi:hypothetical protein
MICSRDLIKSVLSSDHRYPQDTHINHLKEFLSVRCVINNGDVRPLSKDDNFNGPLQARSDLVDILSHDPANTEAIVKIITAELKDMKDSETESEISTALSEASSGVEKEAKDNVLYWLTKTSPDVRQMILVQTIEELLKLPASKESTIDALTRVSSADNVKMVMEWVDRKILTLNQAVYVLLYPDSTAALK